MMTSPFAGGGEAVAVNVTGWPGSDGFGEDTTDISVEAAAVWVSVEDGEGAKFVSPE
jgi:hypothetical protein